MPQAWMKFYGAVVFVLTLFLIGGAALHDQHGFFGANTAAWVQALGSIGAIFAGFAWTADAARQQRQRDVTIRAENLVGARTNARHLAGTAVARLARIVRNIERTLEDPDDDLEVGPVKSMRASVEAQRMILLAFPAHSLESETLINLFSSFPSVMAAVHASCDAYIEDFPRIEGDRAVILALPLLSSLMEALAVARWRLRQFDEVVAGRSLPYDDAFDFDDFDRTRD